MSNPEAKKDFRSILIKMIDNTKLSSTPLYQPVECKTLRAYRFPALAQTTHAVFTRLGGVSQPPWHSLNMGHAVGDFPWHVKANFESACQALNINPQHTVACHLVHGNRVVVAQNGQNRQLLGQADAIITQVPGLYLTMRFADCTPLLFFDPITQSVGLGHAGWRGTMKNVIEAVVGAMRRHFGSKPQDITIAIGPSIGPCCYEVRGDVLDAAQRAFTNSMLFFDERDGRAYFDMWRASVHQAEQAGLKQIIVSELCTACRTDEFFSHRAEKGKTGRFGVFLGIPEN